MHVQRHWFRYALCASVAATSIGVVVACSSSSSGGGTSLSNVTSVLEPSPGTCSTAGSAVLGPQDMHCDGPDGGPIIQDTTVAGCTDSDAGASSGDDGGGGASDAGDIGNCGDNDYGATMYNDQGSDDDCKYDVQW